MALRKFFKTKPFQKKLKIDREALGEAFPDSIDFPKDLQPIVLGYLNGDIDDRKSTPEQRQQFTLFYKNIQTLKVPSQAALAAEKMVWCDADGVEALVKKNPSILKYRIPEVRDPCGRILKNKTLLQIAGAMNEFDPREMKPEEKPYGIVPRLARYLSQKDVAIQLSEQFPSGWEEKTNVRIDEYLAALTTFVKGVINKRVPADSTLKAECKGLIEIYRASLNSAANKEVTIGLIFSPQIFVIAIECFIINMVHFGDWDSDKSDLFWNIGYGALQQRASGDAPIIKCGISNVVNSGKIPNRSLNFGLRRGSYYPGHLDSSSGVLVLSSWGFFLNHWGFGWEPWGLRPLDHDGLDGRKYVCPLDIGKLMSSKNNSLAKFMQKPPDNKSKSDTLDLGEFRNRP